MALWQVCFRTVCCLEALPNRTSYGNTCIEDRNECLGCCDWFACQPIFYGTSIPTCILVLKKCREQPENVLFINAAEHFERGTQNTLRQEDIDRIIDTYRNRKEVPKYSSLASLETIAENEYNMNIPRYVNTFEEEEKIDISAVAKQLKSLEKEMKNTDAELMAFCKELKIDTPF
jgi:type I restriction enzyme M protein